jgi:cell division protein ZapA (FtsZ GTPase activity inhibitor)
MSPGLSAREQVMPARDVTAGKEPRPMPKPERLNLAICGQDFTLAIEPGERDLVQEAARLVEGRMKENAERGAIGVHKQAVMTAFQLAFDYLRLSQDPLAQPETRAELQRRVEAMIQTLDKAAGPKS